MTQKDPLNEFRQEIDAINNQLVKLLNKRAKIAQKIGKAKANKNIYQPGREITVLNQVAQVNTGPLSEESIRIIFKEIIAACRNLERQLKVAYLGPAGTYCEEAARRQLGQTCQFMPYATFGDAMKAAETHQTDVAIVAIENSTEGGINSTQDLLLQSQLKVCGEIMLPVHHQLLSQAKSIGDVSEVAAHPQALAQCRAWLDAHIPNARRKSVNSNAEAAAAASKHKNIAAIASKRAAEIYNLAILASNIEDDSANTTRFLVLGHESTLPTGKDKTSLICSVPNQPGSLSKLLAVLTDAGVSMTRLESRPAKSGLWDYVFYIDIEGHSQDPRLSLALKNLHDAATFVKILGSYPRANS